MGGRVVRAVVVAFVVAFMVYRVALAVFMPADAMWHTPDGAVVPQWDALTGWPIMPKTGVYLTPIEPLTHWYRAFFAGLVVGAFALIAGLAKALSRVADQPTSPRSDVAVGDAG